MPNIDEVVKPTSLLDAVLKLAKRKKSLSLTEIANRLDRGPATIREAVRTLRESRYNIYLKDDTKLEIATAPEQGGKFQIPRKLTHGKSFKFGFIGDTHLASKYARLDALNVMYDIFAEEGIEEVYHGGNLVDGEASFNKYDLLAHGIEGQLEYAANEYPVRKGIATRFICGDDHEGWWAQREGINIGKLMEDRFRAKGRDDLYYIGYLEADVMLPSKSGNPTWIRPMHPGGGSAYAISYTVQKIVESLQGGEKPHVLLCSHYHKMDWCLAREVWCVQGACFQDQTPFLRKKKIQAVVGGWVCEMIQAEDGFVPRFKGDFVRFFDKGFYAGKEKFPRW